MARMALCWCGLVVATGIVGCATTPGVVPTVVAHETSAVTARQQVQVDVYGASWCGPCHVLEASLRGQGVAVRRMDVEALEQIDHPWGMAGVAVLPTTCVRTARGQVWLPGADAAQVLTAMRLSDEVDGPVVIQRIPGGWRLVERWKPGDVRLTPPIV